MKRTISVILVMLLAVSAAGCNSEMLSSRRDTDSSYSSYYDEDRTKDEVSETVDNSQEYETEVLNVLNTTSYIDDIDPSYVEYGLCSDITYGQLLASMFESPQIEISKSSENIFSVTVSGSYRDTPGGYCVNDGNAYLTVDTEYKTCDLTGDHYYLSAATYFALSAGGFY